MPVVFGIEEAEDRVKVTSITYTIDEHPDGYGTAQVPEYPEPIIGINHVMFFNPQADEFFFEQEPRPLTTEEQLQALQETVDMLVLDVLTGGDN